ncbi:DUF4386 domain-containing protein [Marispirochaeta sp.]|uniref:DUF4386 domain-containing protein n=1 Tax=Marispirochaeta sp. TaxID=2038653 RepID=UPI0029C75900|nr:DUF4386 domain-containing protein [Marispirochaeta sp.]
MSTTLNYRELQRTGRIAGIVYLIIFLSGLIAEFIIRQSFINVTNAAGTAGAIAGNESLFRLSILFDIVMVSSDIAIAALFFRMFRQTSELLALLALMFRMTQAVIIAVNLVNLFLAIRLSASAESSHFSLIFAQAHAIGYTLGMIFFAVNLIFLGILMIKADYFPSVLGYFMFVASAGYLTDSFAQVLMTNYHQYADILSGIVFTPAFITELALSLYLIIRGARNTHTGLSHNM